jgi:molecular chaperone DnaJ
LADNFYQILGVSNDASQDDIKRAFHRLARQYHPDVVGPNSGHEEYFKKVTLSYQTLSDPDLRRHYDIRQMVSFKSDAKTTIKDTVDFAVHGFSEFLNDLLFRAGSSATSHDDLMSGQDIEVTLQVRFADAYTGAQYPLSAHLPRICTECKGKGWPPKHPPQKCPECLGKGTRSAKGPLPFKRACKRCNGAGRIQTHVCMPCQGTRFVDKPVQLDVAVPAGVDTGTKIRIRDQGQPGLGGGNHGDLVVCIEVALDRAFERKGDDLHTSVEIGIVDMLLGAKVRVALPDGHVAMNTPPRPELAHAFRLKGKGFMSLESQKRGDLYVSLQVRMPNDVPEPAAKLLRQIADMIPGF